MNSTTFRSFGFLAGLLCVLLLANSAFASITLVFTEAVDGSTNLTVTGSGTVTSPTIGFDKVLLFDVGSFITASVDYSATTLTGTWTDIDALNSYSTDFLVTGISLLNPVTPSVHNVEIALENDPFTTGPDIFGPEYQVSASANFASLDFDLLNPGRYVGVDATDLGVDYELIVSAVPEPAAIAIWLVLACVGVVVLRAKRQKAR